jgi:hypothetical protein
MDKKEIKQTCTRLLIPFIAGIVILTTGILWRTFGNTREIASIYISLLGVAVIVQVGLKLIKFRKYLKENNLL